MQITIYNGSPRRQKSNTDIILKSFIEGFSSIKGNTTRIYYLVDKSKREEHLQAFENSEMIIIAMPLYAFAMPSIVKEFIETLPDKTNNPKRKLGFIIQSGFEESCHSDALKLYFNSLPHFMPCEYLGTVIKGGIEGIAIKPPFMVKKVMRLFVDLGKGLAIDGLFNEKVVQDMAKPYKYSKFKEQMVKLFIAKIGDGYWNKQLKDNGAYEKRFDKPYF